MENSHPYESLRSPRTFPLLKMRKTDLGGRITAVKNKTLLLHEQTANCGAYLGKLSEGHNLSNTVVNNLNGEPEIRSESTLSNESAGKLQDVSTGSSSSSVSCTEDTINALGSLVSLHSGRKAPGVNVRGRCKSEHEFRDWFPEKALIGAGWVKSRNGAKWLPEPETEQKTFQQENRNSDCQGFSEEHRGTPQKSSKKLRFHGNPFSLSSECRIFKAMSPQQCSTCHHCGLSGCLRCSRCKQTYYCSVVCQKDDWPAHKNVCDPVSAANKPEKCSKLSEEKTLNDLKFCVPLSNAIKNPFEVKAKFRLSDLKYLELKRGQQVQVGVTEIKSPGEIFVQVCTQESFEFLSSLAMTKRTISENSSNDQYVPEIGEICAAKYSADRTWHRILIQNIDVACKTAQVFYIDYGNEEEIPLDRIKALFEDMKQFPPCAVKCFIGNIVPVNQVWSEACTISVRQLILGKACTMNILTICKNEMEFGVDFLLPDTGESLAKCLVEKGYAVEKGFNSNFTDENTAESSVSGEGVEKTMLNSSMKEKLLGNPTDSEKFLGHKLISVSVGDVFSAVVTDVQNPEYFFCQMMENGTCLAELQAALVEHCRKMPSDPDFRPTVGTLCCAMFTGDRQWYRASVIKYNSEDSVTVGYVDYGNFEVLHYHRLRPLMTKFLELPLQAITCSLAGVKSTSDTWLPEASSTFKNIVHNKVLAARVTDKKQNLNKLELIDKSSDPFINVAEQLVLAGFAKKVGKEQPIVEVRDGLIGKEPVQPANKITGKWIDLSAKQSLNVIVCFINSPGDFFCQCCNTEDRFALNELNKSLNEYCNQYPPSKTFKLLNGEPCCAFFKGDGNWYRAVGMQCSVKVAKVQFVDYGNEIETTVDKLRPIPSEFLELPFQAIHCCLAGIKPGSTEWTAEATARFQALTVGLELQASVMAISNTKANVELKSSSGSLNNISEVLVKEHLAVQDDKIIDVPALEKCSDEPLHAGCCCKELKKQVDEHEKILAFLLSRLESNKE